MKSSYGYWGGGGGGGGGGVDVTDNNSKLWRMSLREEVIWCASVEDVQHCHFLPLLAIVVLACDLHHGSHILDILLGLDTILLGLDTIHLTAFFTVWNGKY